jgi:hypothetical protein
VPPRVDYELTERARELVPVLGELARWGYEWAWSPPRESERVDLGAIFRLIPGLVGPNTPASGRIELTVSDGNGGEPISYMVTFAPGAATITERERGRADAHMRGDVAAWTRALSPDGTRTGLRATGDRALADALFAMLAPGADRSTAEPAPLATTA